MKTKKILILCPYPEAVAPSQRLKYEQYFPYLRSCGYDLTVSPFMSLRLWKIVYKPGHLPEKIFWTLMGYAKRCFDLLRLPFYDGAYVSLHVTPFGSPFFEFLTRIAARKIVYDIDDLVFLGKSSKANRYLEFFKGPQKIYYQMKSADHVITCTPYLTEIAAKYSSAITDISSTVDTVRYQPKTRSKAGTITLGWSGSYSTSPYLKLLAPVLQELQKKHGCKVLVIGDENFSLPGLQVDAIAWKSASEVDDLNRIDIGLYPLPNEEWVLGKSGLKAIQYMALGIPTVAAALGANFRVIEDGVSGLLAKNEQEWLSQIEKLILNPELREKMGMAARERVEKLFSLKANAGIYEKIFRETF